VAETRAAGSSLKLCLLAAGQADLYPRLGRTMEWDTAAGHAVLAAAGGQVLTLPGYEPLLNLLRRQNHSNDEKDFRFDEKDFNEFH
jgi:3'(2'), 5'-bisphosphate nucleotidase